MTGAELAERIGAEVRGDGAAELTSCASLEDATAEQVSFFTNRRYTDRLAATSAGAVILSPDDAEVDAAAGRTLLIAERPYLAFREALIALHGFRPTPAVGISERAYVDDTAEVGDLCTIRPGAYVAPRAVVGDRVILYPNVYVGKGAVVGNDCVLHPGVCVYDGCVLGQNVTVHAGTVIGQDGLGYASAQAAGDDRPRHHKIPHVGRVVIGDHVELGANCSIDRATVGETRIGEGTKLSNNVVIGHGAKLGRHNLLVAHVGIAGSTVTGDYVTMGGHVGVAGHLTIGSQVDIAADAKVMHDIPDGVQWGGTPARPLPEAKRIKLAEARLPEAIRRIRDLERRLAKLEGNA